MKQIQLITAILLTIKEFGTNTFSIYNITSNIRNHLNNGDYEIIEDGRYPSNLTHQEVKDTFSELLENGLLDGYFTHYNPSGYREFCSVDPNQSQPAVKVTRNTNTVDVRFPPSVQEKMYNYIRNRGPSTMKQIQSRLKGHNYTCQELYDFFNKIGLIDKNATTTNVSEQYTVCL